MVAKSKPPRAGLGRPKGSPNKLQADVRAMIHNALEECGGVEYLKTQARENPNAFLALVGKCLPKEITGADGKALCPAHHVIWGA